MALSLSLVCREKAAELRRGAEEMGNPAIAYVLNELARKWDGLALEADPFPKPEPLRFPKQRGRKKARASRRAAGNC
jgi:hypothetical protein